jgi:hypothetical protein
MKKLLTIIIISVQLSIAKVEVIASETCEVETLSYYDIKNLFMVKKRSFDNVSVTVLDNSDKSIYVLFLEKYLKKSPRMMKTYWVRMLFTGKKTAPKKFSIDELKELDTKTKCYMTYTSSDNIPESWTKVSVK